MVKGLHHNLASCRIRKVAPVADRQSLRLTAATELLQEVTQGQTLSAGKCKTLPLGFPEM